VHILAILVVKPTPMRFQVVDAHTALTTDENGPNLSDNYPRKLAESRDNANG
jgi:hypothetical protein